MQKTLIHQKLPGYLQDVFLRLSSLQQLLPLDSSVTQKVDLDEQEEGGEMQRLAVEHTENISKLFIDSSEKNVIGMHFFKCTF